MSGNYCTQNNLLLTNLLEFYNKNNNLDKILPIIEDQEYEVQIEDNRVAHDFQFELIDESFYIVLD